MKKCIKCKKLLPPVKFYRSVRASDGLQTYCKDCSGRYQKKNRKKYDWHKYSKNWREAHADIVHGYYVKRNYNLSREEFDILVENQHGKCALCNKPPEGRFKRLSVDHDHKNGKVRGLLCVSCNLGLGIYEANKQKYEAYLLQHAS